MSVGGAPYKESELDTKARRGLERMSENLHVLANEPSLAFYRLQEHVRKSLPVIVEKRAEVNRLHEQLQGRCYDVDYAVGAVTNICKSKEPFDNCRELLKNAIFFRQQLRHQESRNRFGSPTVERASEACVSPLKI